MDPSRSGHTLSPHLDSTTHAIPAACNDVAYDQSIITFHTTTPFGQPGPTQLVSAGNSATNVPALEPGMDRGKIANHSSGDAESSTTGGATMSKAENGPSRKQNVACDACRAKKIRCRRTTIAKNVRPSWELGLHPAVLTPVRAVLRQRCDVHEQLYRAVAGQGEEDAAGQGATCSRWI